MRNCDSPAWRSDPASLRNKASMTWALWAPLVHSFWPLIRQPPATFSARERTAARSEPGAGLAQPDTGEQRACRHAGQIFAALRLGAVAQQQRPGLAIGDPVRPDRGSGRQQFLEHDIAIHRRARVPAIFTRPDHADEPRRPERAREIRDRRPTSNWRGARHRPAADLRRERRAPVPAAPPCRRAVYRVAGRRRRSPCSYGTRRRRCEEACVAQRTAPSQ